LGRKPNLESLYLLPLQELVRANGGNVYAGDTSALTLMIDFKSSAEETLHTLLRVMGGYPELFLAEPGFSPPVRVVLSGNRPDPGLLHGQPYALKLDGRLENLGSEHRANYPWVSASWSALFGRRGVDQLSDQERSQLMTWCSKARESGQQLRFWATPEDPELWEDLLALGVYRINTDRPKRFKTFWENRSR
jgi:alkaline phosphatase